MERYSEAHFRGYRPLAKRRESENCHSWDWKYPRQAAAAKAYLPSLVDILLEAKINAVRKTVVAIELTSHNVQRA